MIKSENWAIIKELAKVKTVNIGLKIENIWLKVWFKVISTIKDAHIYLLEWKFKLLSQSGVRNLITRTMSLRRKRDKYTRFLSEKYNAEYEARKEETEYELRYLKAALMRDKLEHPEGELADMLLAKFFYDVE